MKREELYALHIGLCDKALEIMQRKNQDYSASSEDPFANFRGSVVLDTEPELGLMIRMQDKFQRVKAFIKTGKFAVVEEGILDIGHDLINYSILLTGMLLERAEAQKEALKKGDPNPVKAIATASEPVKKRPYKKRKVVKKKRQTAIEGPAGRKY